MDLWDLELERTQTVLDKLGPWPQNIMLPNGLETAPERGDKDAQQAEALLRRFPAMSGVRVLDLACRSGALSFALAQQGAQVFGIDPDARHIAQARWLRRRLGHQHAVRLRQAPVYAVARMNETFDIVLLMEGFRRIRYATLAFDLACEKSEQWLVLPADDSESTPEHRRWITGRRMTGVVLERPTRDLLVWKVSPTAPDGELRSATGRPAVAVEK